MYEVYRGDTDNPFVYGKDKISISAGEIDSGGFTIVGEEALMYDENEWIYVIAPEHLGELRTALDARGEEDLVTAVERRFEDGTIPGRPWSLGKWLSSKGVHYSGTAKLMKMGGGTPRVVHEITD